MIEITLANFQTDIVPLSQTTPVVLDFYSPRSPACTGHSATLLSLEAAYGGAFTLARIDADAQPQIAQAFQIQSLPTTIVFKAGQPVDGFGGAMAEAQIRQIFDTHMQAIVPVDERPPELIALAAAQDALSANDANTALVQLEQALALKPDFDAARLMLVQVLLDIVLLDIDTIANTDRARAELDLIDSSRLGEAQSTQYTALEASLNAASRAASSPEILALRAQVADKPTDLTARMALCKALGAVGAFEAALEQALAVVQQDRNFDEQAGRKAMVALFAQAAGAPDLVRAWRGKLSAALN